MEKIDKYNDAFNLIAIKDGDILLSIKKYLKKNHIKQQDLADKMGIKQSNLNVILNNKHSPSLNNFIKLVEIINFELFIEKKLIL